MREVAGVKQTADLLIGAKTEAVQNILSLVEIKGFEGQEPPTEKEVSNPEEILNKVMGEFSRLKNPSIDDISNVLLTSGLEIRDVQIWLARNYGKIQSLTSSRENLQGQISELSGRLEEENRKNFLVRLLRSNIRRSLTQQLENLSQNAAKVGAALETLGVRSGQVEAAMREILERRQELAINAAEQLFQEVVRVYDQLKESLTAPEVKKELNESLFAKRIIPKLEQLQKEGRITKGEAEEYVELLKKMLALAAALSVGNEPIEDFEAIFARMLDLKIKSNYALSDVDHLVSAKIGADYYYDTIFDFLIRELTRERIEQLRDTLGASLSPELQKRLGEIAEGIINPNSDALTPVIQRQLVLDLNKIPFDDFKQLDGLERW